jgi:hypothetical protein
LVPIFDGCGAILMLLLESVDRKAANNVVREEQNVSETKECVQMRKKLGSTTLYASHMDKRSDTDP